jgi:hypothetical protein
MTALKTAQAGIAFSRPIELKKKERKAHIWAKDPHDWYVEPRWCSERLFALEKFEGEIHDPACGIGRIVKNAIIAGYEAAGSDIIARPGFEPLLLCNFLDPNQYDPIYPVFNNIVTNPPFRHAREFVELSLKRAERKVAMLLPVGWVLGDDRSRWLAATPLRRVLFLTPRPSMPPGDLIQAGMKPEGGRVDFAWYIWHRGYDGKPELGWCRRDA